MVIHSSLIDKHLPECCFRYTHVLLVILW